jgi:hypothetical protein
MNKSLCVLKRYKANDTFESYTCDEVRALYPKWHDDFLKTNRVDISRTDTYYDRWKKEIEDFLVKCNCETKEICESKNSGHWIADQIELGKNRREKKGVTMEQEVDIIIKLLNESE